MNTVKYIINSISELRLLSLSGVSDNTVVFVSGYYGPGTDGSGSFYYSNTSTTPDNGGTVIQPTVGVGRWLRINQGSTLTPEIFGAKGDGATDDLSAIQAAITAIQTMKGTLSFAAKNYMISNYLEISVGFCGLAGCGKNRSYIISTSQSADIIRLSGTTSTPLQNVSIRGFGLSRSVTPTGGRGISLTYTAVARIEDIQSDASATGVYLYQAPNTFINDVLSTITSGSAVFTGFWLNGGNSISSVSSILTGCVAVKTSGHSGNSFGFVCDGFQAQDLKFINPETAGTAYGLYFNGTNLASGQYIDDIEILNPVCDQITATGIAVVNSGAEGSISITDGWINPAPNADAYCIYFDNTSGVNLKGLQFYADTDYAKSRGLGLNNCSRVVATDNIFTSQNYGVFTSGTNTGCNISNNSFFAQNSTKASATCLNLVGCKRCVFSGNIFSGYATTAISIVNSTNEKNILTSNSIDPTHFTNTIIDNGVSTVLANNITT